MERGVKALYMVPLRALASEKYEEIRSICEELGIRVGISTGDYDSPAEELARYDVLVCTNEKCDSITRHKPSWLGKVGVVVADEVHLLTDPHRGVTLEVVLSRLRQLLPDAQFIALSATINNAEEMAGWLNAKLVKSDWRPVKLKEGVYLPDKIHFNDGSVREVDVRTGDEKVNLVIDTVREGGQVLMFVNTRRKAMKTAEKLSRYVKNFLTREEKGELKRVAKELAEEGGYVAELLAKLIVAGVAFHHAGLGHRHRRLIEDYFRENYIKAVCATPTLAAGVNLPARRVVIVDWRRYEPGIGLVPIPVLEYKQMAGRAGRPKYDRYGEAILIAKSPSEKDFLFEEYVYAETERIWSKLANEEELRTHVLASIATGLSTDVHSLMGFLEKTFYAYQIGSTGLRDVVDKTIDFLKKEALVTRRGDELRPTRFGRRVSELYIDPVTAVILRDGLKKAENTGVVTDFAVLHLVCLTPDMEKLKVKRSEVEELVSTVDEHFDEFLVPVPDFYWNPEGTENFFLAVKTAKLFMDWINEEPEEAIMARFNVWPGDLVRYAELGEWLLYSAVEIGKLLGVSGAILEKLAKLMARVKHGVKEELLELVSLKGVGRVRARNLYNKGFKTLEDLRKASVWEIASVPSIGLKLAKEIKVQVSGSLDEEESEERLTERLKGEQQKLTFYME